MYLMNRMGRLNGIYVGRKESVWSCLQHPTNTRAAPKPRAKQQMCGYFARYALTSLPCVGITRTTATRGGTTDNSWPAARCCLGSPGAFPNPPMG